jgi:hypothetical protein
MKVIIASLMNDKLKQPTAAGDYQLLPKYETKGKKA